MNGRVVFADTGPELICLMSDCQVHNFASRLFQLISHDQCSIISIDKMNYLLFFSGGTFDLYIDCRKGERTTNAC